jgi:hypothetical protein
VAGAVEWPAKVYLAKSAVRRLIKSSHKKLDVPHAVILRELMSASTTVKLSPRWFTATHVFAGKEVICSRTSMKGVAAVNDPDNPP